MRSLGEGRWKSAFKVTRWRPILPHARFRREGDLKHANAVTTHVSSSPALGSALLPKRPNKANEMDSI